ncbi:MAG: hypothetical protein LBQ90_06010 [Synergistaceae bacterium]|jgi:hypothetical protein|nr:hypothetical protein [Synergistaceae bacterium]
MKNIFLALLSVFFLYGRARDSYKEGVGARKKEDCAEALQRRPVAANSEPRRRTGVGTCSRVLLSLNVYCDFIFFGRSRLDATSGDVRP